MQWNEQDHPRDDDGKFTFKEGGILKGSIEKTKNNEGILGKLLGGYSLGEIKDILLSVISTAAPSIIKTGLTIAKMKNFIKENNLEKELIKKIEDIKTNKETQKTNPEKDKNSFVSLGNNHNNHTNSKVKLNNKMKETPKDILFASSNINNQLKLKQDEYKSKLLDILGNHATQGDVLYGKPESLEKKVRDLGLGRELDKIKSFEQEVKEWEKKIEYSKIPILGKMALSAHGGSDAAGMLNLAEEKFIPLYMKDTIKLKNINDIANMSSGLSKFKQHMEDKINEQFKDFNYDKNNVKGYVFKNNSAVADRIKESKEFKNIINANIGKILKGENFTGKFVNDFNLHNAYGKVDFLNSGIDNQGNLHLYMFDTYDFNKNESNPKIEAGRRQMLKENLKPFFTIHEIIIPKEDYGKYGVEG